MENNKENNQISKNITLGGIVLLILAFFTPQVVYENKNYMIFDVLTGFG